MPKNSVRCGGLFLVLVFAVLFVAPSVRAQSLTSPNYKFEESTIGAGGLVESNSTNFQGVSSVGDVGNGDSASTNLQSSAGSKSTEFPRLAVSVNGGVNFPTFSATTPAMATTTFSVLNYTSYGYSVYIFGDPPKHDNHSIATMTTPYTSSPGFEQFGINLVANTSPQSIGANPDQGQFGFGVATDDYNDANQYRYSDGAMIASAPKSSGITNYTMSYLVNVSALTPGGQYSTNQTLIITGSY